jgi:hypothetical protein
VALAALAAALALLADDPDPIAMSALVVIPLTGAFIVARRPGNRIGLLMLVTGAVVIASATFDAYARFAATRDAWPAGQWSAWLSSFTFWGPLELYLVLLLVLFPTGQPVSGRWRALIVFELILASIQVVIDMFEPGRFDAFSDYPQLTNPVVVPVISERTDTLIVIHDLGLFVAISLAVASIVVRFRRSRGIERQQLRWFAYVAVVLVALIAVMAIGGRMTGDVGRGVEFTAGVLMLLVVVAGLPFTIAIAVLRYRLYEIDHIINRTIVYAVLSVSLLLTYLALVLALGGAMRSLTGGDSSLVTAASTLIVAALFRPLRTRIQHVVDRRFNRARYDAARTLEAFAARLRDEIDLEALDDELRAVVREAMQPTHVSLWMRSPGGREART